MVAFACAQPLCLETLPDQTPLNCADSMPRTIESTGPAPEWPTGLTVERSTELW
ncbi:MAG: hypothetical protein J07HX64_01974 [halophilic archaeon J07HX64]|nr:MAG: hypothetical protein J07HX64_01974 [halophilic archaeon J07HX64]